MGVCLKLSLWPAKYFCDVYHRFRVFRSCMWCEYLNLFIITSILLRFVDVCLVFCQAHTHYKVAVWRHDWVKLLARIGHLSIRRHGNITVSASVYFFISLFWFPSSVTLLSLCIAWLQVTVTSRQCWLASLETGVTPPLSISFFWI